MPSFWEQLLWVLQMAAREAKDQAAFYIENPGEAVGDLKAWAKANKATCAFLAGGAIVLIVPLAVGFAPGGVVGGSLAALWQSSIGNVVVGSLFATLQSLAMSGTFISIGGWLLGIGAVKLLAGVLGGVMGNVVTGLRGSLGRALPPWLAAILGLMPDEDDGDGGDDDDDEDNDTDGGDDSEDGDDDEKE